MPISRNQLARNKKTRQKINARLLPSRKEAELNNVCEKHGIGELSFRSCKLAAADGTVTHIDHDKIRGNLKTGFMLVKATGVDKAGSDTVYDLVKITKDKAERDAKKKHDELERSRQEVERLQAANTVPDIEGASDQHKQMLEKLMDPQSTTSTESTDVQPTESTDVQPTESTDVQPTESTDIQPTESTDGLPTEQTEPISEPVDDMPQLEPTTETSAPTETKKLTKKEKREAERSAKAKRSKAVSKLREQMVAETKASDGNKFYRKFMTDINAKFTLEPATDYQYFEVKSDATDMVIDGVKVYRVVMPAKTKETYLLIVGDLQMKRRLIMQIDPSYQSEQVADDQAEFLKRIMEKEGLKENEIGDDLDVLDNDLDELDAIDVADDQSVLTSNTNTTPSDPANPTDDLVDDSTDTEDPTL